MKLIKITLASLIAIFIFSNFQCEDEKIETCGPVEYISYGTSFGECIGYCIREVVVSGGASFTKRGWDQEGSLPDSSCSLVFIQDPLPGYMEKIDLDAFWEMEETIGCPDCADGGAEWVEIGSQGKIKRVTFEYMNAPEAFMDLVPSLRELLDSFNDCWAPE